MIHTTPKFNPSDLVETLAASTVPNNQSRHGAIRKLTRSAIADDDELEAGVIHGPLIRERLRKTHKTSRIRHTRPQIRRSNTAKIGSVRGTHHLGRTGGGPRLMRRCGGLRSTGSGSSKTLEFEIELGEPPVEAEGFIAAVAYCFFFSGCGVFVALDGRRNCGRRILGGGWGSHPASFPPTRDFWTSDPKAAVEGWTAWALCCVR